MVGFVGDEDAIKRLGILLRKIEGSPLLLVLDDVWPGSEALIEKFQFQMSDYKIVVTSRVAFPKFGTPYVLKPLAHEDAMTLFRHHALLEKSSSHIPDKEIVQKVLILLSDIGSNLYQSFVSEAIVDLESTKLCFES